MGDIEAILAQSASAAAFGDEGRKLVNTGMYLAWSLRMVPIIAVIVCILVCIIMYGPSSATLLVGFLTKYFK